MKNIPVESALTKRILYVEEHEDSREMLTLTLENEGYTVCTAASLVSGMNRVKSEHFDLYILDGGYNDGSGVELCRQIRANDPVTPIIFYSSLAYTSDIEAGMAAGAQDYLTKPMGIYTINQTIAGLLTSPAVAQETAH